MKSRWRRLLAHLFPRRNTTSRGLWAENLAFRHLRKQGLRPVTRNYACKGGEIDLIMRQGDIFVFVEVRYRRDESYGTALESIDWRKQQRILHCARLFQQANKRVARSLCRFDIIVIGENAEGKPDIQWLPDAFRDK